MAFEQDELNRRRRSREEHRKKRQRAQRQLYFRLIVAVAVLLISGLAIFLLTRDNASEPAQEVLSGEIGPDKELSAATEAATEAKSSRDRAPTVIHLTAAGDLNITDKVIWSGQNGTTYDYTNAFMDVASLFGEADISVLNLEGTVSGVPYGTETTSAPQELLAALKNAGVDLIQVANSCSVNKGLIGLQSTLSNIRAAGLEPVGAFADSAEFRKSKGYTLCTVNGITIAFVAFTKGVGGRGMPTGSEDCVNLLYTDYYTTYQDVDTEGIRTILRNVAAEKPDLTVALLHWGSEYNEEISDSQKTIVSLMQKEGVDAIIGTHSHLVQKIDYNSSTGQLVAYSLGDFFGDAKEGGTYYSIVLDLEITKDHDTGVTRITDYSYTPIYTLAEDECDGDRRVVRIENAMAAYDLNFVDKVTDACYSNMQYALQRISARVNGE